MITFAVETWKDLADEILPLLAVHWEEVGQDKTRMVLDPDYKRYTELEETGALHVVTARREGKLVGYHVTIISRLLHYQTVLAGMSDIYWLQKDCRNGSAAIRLFQEVEKTTKARGVQVLYDNSKVYLDHTRLFLHLGYKPVETRYSKWIGD